MIMLITFHIYYSYVYRKLRHKILGYTSGTVLLTSILGQTNSIKLDDASRGEPQFGQIATAVGLKTASIVVQVNECSARTVNLSRFNSNLQNFISQTKLGKLQKNQLLREIEILGYNPFKNRPTFKIDSPGRLAARLSCTTPFLHLTLRQNLRNMESAYNDTRN
jgi:hypothetical protein